MTTATTVRETRTDPWISLDVSSAVPDTWPESLPLGEFALKELSSPTNRAGRIALDDVDGRVRRHHITDARSILLTQGFRDPDVGRVRRLLEVDQLGFRGWWSAGNDCQREIKSRQRAQTSDAFHAISPFGQDPF